MAPSTLEINRTCMVCDGYGLVPQIVATDGPHALVAPVTCLTCKGKGWREPKAVAAVASTP